MKTQEEVKDYLTKLENDLHKLKQLYKFYENKIEAEEIAYEIEIIKAQIISVKYILYNKN